MPFTKRRKRETVPRDIDLKDWENLHSLPADKENRQPARTIISSTSYRIVGGFDLPDRTSYPLEWESYLERVSYFTLAMCHDVEWMGSQPDELRYVADGSPRTYYPDLLVQANGSECFLEVKPLVYLVQDENLTRYADIASRLRARGKRLVFLTDDQILSVKARTENIMLMRRYITGVLAEEKIGAVHEPLVNQPLSIKELVLTGTVDVRDIHTMIAQHHLVVEWDVLITLDAAVRLPTSDDKGLTFERILSSGRFSHLLAQLSLGHRPTDQRELALAKAYGQRMRSSAGPSIAGGFPKDKSKRRIYEPLDDLRETLSSRTAGNGKRASRSLLQRGAAR
ncbi:hypothetical protein N0A02_11935 [Paraburkholderia acidicola]|uniref:TnsA endonuclease N-terminal domain-containing protein n=1 Tax=Paraburkholderia acidicola TaxID=1912599 RepID=A0ABV1LN16_9BURK